MHLILFIVVIVVIMVIIDRVFKIVADIIWYKLDCGNKQQPIISNNIKRLILYRIQSKS
jgi:hypothetical protein